MPILQNKTLLFLLILLFSCSSGFSQYPIFDRTLEEENAEHHYTSKDQILLKFSQGMSKSEKVNVLKGFEELMPFESGVDLSGNDLFIARLDQSHAISDEDFYQALNNLRSLPEIDWANVFLRDDNGRFWGVTNTLVLKFREDFNDDEAYVNAMVEDYELVHRADPYMDRVHYFEMVGNQSALSWSVLINDPEIFEYVHPDYLFNPIVATNDSLYNHQWAINNNGTGIQGSGTSGADMSVENAWLVTTGDPNIRIGILDSGTDTLHPDLKPNLLPGYDATGGGQQGYPNDSLSEDAHGTACAGIAAAKGDNNIGIAGICYDCKIVPVRVFYYAYDPLLGIQPYSTGTWMADAINWAADSADVDIMSNSWGIPDFLIPFLPGGQNVVNNAIVNVTTNGRGGLGIPMFFSSGNDGGAPIWPSRQPQVIAVGATSMCDERKTNGSCDNESWASNAGDSLDIAAPGVRIASTDMVGANGYRSGDYTTTFNGTSAACPNAAGVMGLILSFDPSLSLEKAREYIEVSCDKVGGYSYGQTKKNGSWSFELGYGRVNAERALIATSRQELSAPPLTKIHIYPNPTSGQFQMELDLQRASEIQYKIFDAQGKMVFSEDLGFKQPGPVNIHHDFKNQSPGIYLFTLKAGVYTFTKKIILKP